ncbi:3066_t:CDS:1, partial [Funneliformis caledonium]
MENSILYMGSNLEEEIANYLIYLNRLCYVIEDTFERIPVNEEERKLDKEVKNHRGDRFEKMLLEVKASLVFLKRKKQESR